MKQNIAGFDKIKSERTMDMEYIGLTDKGRSRDKNEDKFYCGNIGQDRVMAVVVDGCGGHKGGDVCARIVVREMSAWVQEHWKEEPAACLKEAAVQANNAVMLEKVSHPEWAEMCCVMTAVITDPQKNLIHMVHVGDSRLYAYQAGRLVKLSHDHSPVGEMEEKGYLSEKEAMNHVKRNLIRRAIGTKQLPTETEYLECKSFPMAPGMGWILCSDGLSDMLTSAQMAGLLGEELPLRERVNNLVQAANEAGGKDNITVVLVQDMSESDHTTEEVFLGYGNSLAVHQETTDPTENDGVVLELVSTTTSETPKTDVPKKKCRFGIIHLYAALVFLLCTMTVCMVVHQKIEQYQQQELYWQNKEVLKRLYYNINNN